MMRSEKGVGWRGIRATLTFFYTFGSGTFCLMSFLWTGYTRAARADQLTILLLCWFRVRFDIEFLHDQEPIRTRKYSLISIAAV